MSSPTASLTVEPQVIQHGQIVTLKWVTTGADELSLQWITSESEEVSHDGWKMEPSGEICVWVEKSTTFHLVARNRFGTTRAEARVTMEEAMADTKQATPDDKQNDIALFSAEHDFGNAKYFYAARTAIAELKRLLASRSGPDRTPDTVEYWKSRATTAELKVLTFHEEIAKLREEEAPSPATDAQREKLTTVNSRKLYIRAKLYTLVSSQIRAVRLKRGLSQKQLADLCGMKQARISEMETAGACNYTIATLARIAAALGIALQIEFCTFAEMLDWQNSYSQDSFDVTPITSGVVAEEEAGAPTQEPK